MSRDQRSALNKAYRDLTSAFEVVLDSRLDDVAGIGRARNAITAAKNAVGGLLPGMREPPRRRVHGGA